MNLLRRIGGVRYARLLVAAGVALTCFIAFAMRRGMARSGPPRDAHPFVELDAPRVDTPIRVDAELEGQAAGQGAWESEIGSTKVFKDPNGKGMVPYTEARVRWGDGVLYLWLYAGDLDLEGSVKEHDGPVLRDDAFHLEFGAGDRVRTIDVSVLGTVADAECRSTGEGASAERVCDASWDSHAAVSVDRDGTVNRLGDNDEEWVVEMAIPLKSLGLAGAGAGARIPFGVSRCDVSRDGKHGCGSFGLDATRGEIVLDDALTRAPVARTRP